MVGAGGGRVLVAEDDPGLAGLLVEVLREEGYRAVTASGVEALALARADPPQLILLDVLMPGLDGLAVWRRLRGDPRTREVPVVFATALPAEVLAPRLAGCGHEAVLAKPFTLDQLVATVRRVTAPDAAGPGRAAGRCRERPGEEERG